MKQINPRKPITGRLLLQEYLPYRFSIIAEGMSRHLARRYHGKYGLKRHEWRLMHILSEGATMTTQQVIEKTSLDRLRVSRAAIRLEDKGFLARVSQPHDARAHLLQLTPRGRTVYEEIVPLAHDFQNFLIEALDAQEVIALDSILAKLTRALATDGAEDGDDGADD